MFPSRPRCRLRPLLGLALLLATPVLAVDAGPVPLAAVPEGTPYTRAYAVQQFRLNEAETKARLLQKTAAGDPIRTASMDQYDVTGYRLDLDLDHEARVLTGSVEVLATVTAGPLPGLELHLRENMTVTGAACGGVATSFTRNGEILGVVLDRSYQTGETVAVTIDYQGNPEGEYFGWASYGGQPLIWTLSEPYGARWWWPCKDLNTDKADSVDVNVTVADNLVVAGNGLQAPPTVPGPGRKTYHWRERYPIATYLVSVTAHPYAVLNDSYTGLDGRQMPLEHYVLPSRAAAATAGYAATPDMIAAFARGFGEYPFFEEKYGHAHFPWGGGMEHQTMTSVHYDAYDEFIISHELAHQWWGDMVTCADFGHIWLNEGFATWSEAYWREMNEGPAAYREEMNQARYLGDGTIFVEDPNNFYEIFNYYLSYQKASWVPHMLRHVLGDAAFFAGLAQYREAFAYGSATTEQFRDVMEQAGGRDLDVFFQQWIYQPSHPVYGWTYQLEPSAAGMRLGLHIRQDQPFPAVFAMPLDVRVWRGDGTWTDHTVENDRREQWFSLEVGADAIAVELDPDDWVLCVKSFEGLTPVQPAARAVQPALTGNWPNPFNPRTTLGYTLPADQPVSLVIHDAAGRQVALLVDGMRSAGSHQVVWDGRDGGGARVASGVYFARLVTAAGISTRKITMVQ